MKATFWNYNVAFFVSHANYQYLLKKNNESNCPFFKQSLHH